MTTAIIVLSVFAAIGWGLSVLLFIRSRGRSEVQQGPPPALTEWDRKFMAVHEAGHAVVQMSLFGADSVQYIAIEPGAEGFGCMHPRENPNHNQTRSGLIDEMAVALAGRLAEELILHETTTSIIHDLQKVRFLAKGMVTEWAMCDNTRYVEFDPAGASEARKQQVETDLESLIHEAEEKAKTVLQNDTAFLQT